MLGELNVSGKHLDTPSGVGLGFFNLQNRPSFSCGAILYVLIVDLISGLLLFAFFR